MQRIICPNQNCGYRGLPKRVPRGSLTLGCLLTLLLFPIGAVYFLFTMGYRYRCPNCGMQIAVDN